MILFVAVVSVNVRSGSIATDVARVKIHRCPLLPKATVRHQNVICRNGPIGDIPKRKNERRPGRSLDESHHLGVWSNRVKTFNRRDASLADGKLIDVALVRDLTMIDRWRVIQDHC